MTRIVALTILLCSALLLTLPSANADEPVTAWEYRLVRMASSTDMTPTFNRLGSEGWELVTIHDRRAYFKRVKSDKQIAKPDPKKEVNIELIDELGVIVIRGKAEDVKSVQQIIKKIGDAHAQDKKADAQDKEKKGVNVELIDDLGTIIIRGAADDVKNVQDLIKKIQQAEAQEKKQADRPRRDPDVPRDRVNDRAKDAPRDRLRDRPRDQPRDRDPPKDRPKDRDQPKDQDQPKEKDRSKDRPKVPQADKTPHLEIYAINQIDMDTTVAVLKVLLAKSPGVRFEADRKANRLIVLGTTADQDVVKATLQKMVEVERLFDR